MQQLPGGSKWTISSRTWTLPTLSSMSDYGAHSMHPKHHGPAARMTTTRRAVARRRALIASAPRPGSGVSTSRGVVYTGHTCAETGGQDELHSVVQSLAEHRWFRSQLAASSPAENFLPLRAAPVYHPDDGRVPRSVCIHFAYTCGMRAVRSVQGRSAAGMDAAVLPSASCAFPWFFLGSIDVICV